MSADELPAPWRMVRDGLLTAATEHRLGHALLLVTEREDSAPFQELLKQLFRGLLCMKPGLKACGDCPSCLLLTRPWEEIQHPDAIFLKPENTKGYSVAQIRSLTSSFQLTRSLSPARLCRLENAELLSAGGGSAANALLKLLEEPRPHSYLILTTTQVESVLPTLRSRCQSFKFTGGATLAELDASWSDFVTWTLRGAGALPLPSAPPDHESFWGERDAAIAELEEVYRVLWLRSRPALGELPREASIRVLDIFAEFEALIKKLRGYAAPALQWANFKTQIYAAIAET